MLHFPTPLLDLLLPPSRGGVEVHPPASKWMLLSLKSHFCLVTRHSGALISLETLEDITTTTLSREGQSHLCFPLESVLAPEVDWPAWHTDGLLQSVL